MIHPYIPYAPSTQSKNIGWACNQFMQMLPPNDWACFIDHDALFTTSTWYKLLESVAAKADRNNIGMYTACTNRVGNPEQIVFPKDSPEAQNHDFRFHRKIGQQRSLTFGESFRIAKRPLSGIVMLLSREVWSLTSGFKNGFLGVDNDIDFKIRQLGYQTAILDGLYMYHWYRADAQQNDLRPIGYPI